MWDTAQLSSNVTIVNVEGSEPVKAGFRYLQADGRALPYRDRSFDLAFSNSVIEHVGTHEDQVLFAKELLRVGKRVYCQTPNRWFPIEPHFLAVCVHWLPRKWFTYCVHRYLTLHGLLDRPSRAQSSEMIASIKLLDRRELLALFPGCKIRTERVLGTPKSYIVWR
jgi:SAM-dependent methyltransferase